MRILGVPIDGVTMDQAVQVVGKMIKDRGRPHMVVTANSEMIVAANYDPLLLHIMERADLVVPDGIGVVWAARLLGCPVPQRVPGVDLMKALLSEAEVKEWKVFLLGAAPGVAEKAAEAILAEFPALRIVGCHHGFFGKEDETTLIQDLRESDADILFAALGVPRQEKWAAAHLGTIGIPVSMGVGGSFNIWAGIDKRAPQWMQRIGLEWLYRFARQPQRWRRMGALPHFAFAVLWDRLKNGRQKVME